MIHIRSAEEIKKIRSACAITAEAMSLARDTVKPGVATIGISEKVRKFIESRGAKAAFLGYNGFPGSICISLNEEVVHGIPDSRLLKEGDIVKIDIGTYYDGFYGDMTRTFSVGTVIKETAELVIETEKALYLGLYKAVAGNHIGDIGYAIQSFVEEKGYSVVRSLVGHGIGRNLHEDPQVPNFGNPGAGAGLKNGMVLSIEPMVNEGTWKVKTLENNWTVVTADGKMSSHFENTCVVRDDVPEVLTLMHGEEKWQRTIQ